MSTKKIATQKLKEFSKDCQLIYHNDGENTFAKLVSPTKPWDNGYKGDVKVYYEAGTTKKSFWSDVVDQIEINTGL